MRVSMKKINNKKDILLLLLYSPGSTDKINEPIKGRTRLTKMVFLFKEESFSNFIKDIPIKLENFYNFFAWNYGPFSKEVYDDLNFFILNDFIKSELTSEETFPEAAEETQHYIDQYIYDNSDSYEYQEEEFTLSQKGTSFTSKLFEQLSNNQKDILRHFKANYVEMPLRALLRYVYKKYPNQTSKSTIKHKIGA